MDINMFIKKYKKNDNDFIDAFVIYDDLEDLLGKPPNIKIFKNVISVLKEEFKKKIININDVLEIEYEEDILTYDEEKEKKLFKKTNLKEDNIKLIKEYKKTKDINIRNKIIVNNLSLIKKYAYKYSLKSSLEFGDLINEGVFGMIRAIENFDVNNNNEFSTYAVYWIKQSITRAIQEKGYIIRLPVHLHEKIKEIIGLENKLHIKGLNIDKEEICKNFNISIDKYYELKKLNNTFLHLTSLNTVVGEDEESELIEFIFTDEDESLEDYIIKKELKEEIDMTLSTLTSREEEIIRQRFGLDDGERKTLEQIGKKYGVTRERIRQIEVKALKKLRHPIRSKKFQVYIS